MKKVLLILVVCLLSGSVLSAAEEDRPAKRGEKKSERFFSDRASNSAVAVVNGEAITLEDLKNAVGVRHEGLAEDKTSSHVDFTNILDRMINAKLIVQEARNIGLDEQPEFKKAMESFSTITLREMLQQRQIVGLKADMAEADRIYRESVKEYKIKLVMFETEPAAKK